MNCLAMRLGLVDFAGFPVVWFLIIGPNLQPAMSRHGNCRFIQGVSSRENFKTWMSLLFFPFCSSQIGQRIPAGREDSGANHIGNDHKGR